MYLYYYKNTRTAPPKLLLSSPSSLHALISI